MESSTIKKEINTVEFSEKNSTSTSSKTQLNLDYTELINELSQINQDGDSLLKEMKFEEAKIKYLQGYNKVENETEKSNILYTINPQLEKILSKYKFQIDTVDNGKDCIYKIKSDIHYDMIFLDHMMDEMDGLEVLHILKKFDVFDVPPIVCLTANAISGMREMYLNEGFDEYLSKPIDTAELNRIILKYFKDKK